MLLAIDMHAHIHTGEKVKRSSDQLVKDGVSYHMEKHGHHPDEMAQMYQRLQMMAVIFDVDHETRTGVKISNAETAGWMQKYPKTFIGFGSVDPWKGNAAVDEVKRCADMGLRGMKFQQATQAFNPTNSRFFPIYEACVRLKLPVIFHTGTTAIGAGTPGGRGLVLEYCRPIPYIDEIAARYPELRIIIAHPAWPWQDEMLAIAMHKENVYLDLSGWSPKYFPPSLVQYTNTFLKDKVMFGSNHPYISPKRWLDDYDKAGFKPELKEKILKENAKRVLKLEIV